MGKLDISLKSVCLHLLQTIEIVVTIFFLWVLLPMSHVGKAATLLFWLIAIYNSMVPLEKPVGTVLPWVAPLVLVIHCLEVLFFTRRFAALGRKLALIDSVQIMVFGGFHLMCLLRKESSTGQYNVSDHHSA